MHGREVEEKKRWRHMLMVPSPGTATASPSPPSSVAVDFHRSSPDSFLKDGRRFRVGDCALFQAGNSPPFIGIIRWFALGKEDHLELGVNWLYRPADIKLAKGILLEAAPNEVFYSFHKDEISAESLLHPCKVAFLRKGIELPAGISSFVCRRVYDIANKCLWWLTDQDYINERQEEVDQLLDKTRVEMHAAVQSGGRSPKPLNGPTSTQQVKSGSDSVPNSNSSFSSQVKGKKRERGDQGLEPIKRERYSKTDDDDIGNFKLDSMIKSEVAKITDNGGLINTEGVEKLVQLMQPDRADRKIDVAGRILLADVIAATDRFDCLVRFVELRGVPVLDDWLREAHKGKTGDGTSPKEGDKSFDELLLALLRALDKLPVNLNALQTCNVGKSVNHLRGHKNLEIQKKARSLVDTWKKRVDAEMTKINDAKSIGASQPVSWPGKTGLPDVSHGGNKRSGSTEVMKSSITQPSACKTLPLKPCQGDASVKSTLAPTGSLKLSSQSASSVAIGPKDSLGRIAGSSGAAELPLTTIKEEKSSSSGQSQNNSQSCSSEHAKTVGTPWKEDARSSTAGSLNASKTSGGTSRHRKSSNGFMGNSVSGGQKEASLGKSGSLNRCATSDKGSQSGPAFERTLDMSSDHGNNHRLIVRIPNPGRSPARSASGGSFEDHSIVGSRASSPGIPEKHDHNDRKTKGKGDVFRGNVAADGIMESWQGNDVKEGVVGSDEGDRSSEVHLDEERRNDGIGKAMDMSRATCSSPAKEKRDFLTDHKSGKSYEASFNSIDALIESVKYSEPSASLSAGNDGMKLLASVAAGDLVSPIGSPGTSLAPEDTCTGSEAKAKVSDGGLPDDNADADSEMCGNCVCPLVVKDEVQGAPVAAHPSGDSKKVVPLPEDKSTGNQKEHIPASSFSLCRTADSCTHSGGRPEIVNEPSPLLSSLADSKKEDSENDGANHIEDKMNTSGQIVDGLTKCKPKVGSPSSDGTKLNDRSRENIAECTMTVSDFVCISVTENCSIDHGVSRNKKEKEASDESHPPPNTVMKKSGSTEEGLSTPVSTKKQVPAVAVIQPEIVSRTSDAAVNTSGSGNVSTENVEECKEPSDYKEVKDHLETSENERKESTSHILDGRVCTGNDVEENLERKEAPVHDRAGSASHEGSPRVSTRDTEQCAKSMVSKLSGAEADESEESAEASSLAVSAGPDIGTKLDFDLNEGFPSDEGNQVEPVISSAPGCSSAVHLPSLSPFTISPTSGSPSPITVAAPAKGPFIPPENLLKGKGEPGWKGSAATSAFRPAEPRKLLEMPLGTFDVSSYDGTSGKHIRPPLAIDLNMPDEGVLEDMGSQSSAQETASDSGVVSNHGVAVRSAGGLDLDLNRADEGLENGQFSLSSNQRLEIPLLPVRPASGGIANGEANVFRDFDLNNGPNLDEVGVDSVPRALHMRSNNMPFLSPFSALRGSSTDMGNLSSWFPPGNSYPAVAIPSFLPDRGDRPYPMVAAPGAQRILGSATGGTSFGADIYRGPVLSSSPAMAFSPAAAFPYAGFPFGSSFPVASTSFSGGSTAYVDSSTGGSPCFPTIPSQFVGQPSALSSQYMRPFVISLPEGSSNSVSESTRKWSRQGLDLNAGPGSADMEARDERLMSAPRQLSVASSQVFTEEQARMYQLAGGAFKRKEPEGGWDAERLSYKQPSWQ